MKTSRRIFLGGLSSFGMLGGCKFFGGNARAANNRKVFDYWCTWGIQNGLVRRAAKNNPEAAAGAAGASAARDNINAELIFGKREPWCGFFPENHDRLYMMLDDGWDVTLNQAPGKDISVFGSLEPDAGRFGRFGATPAARLKGINDALRDRGWRGAGLWVACQLPGESGKSKRKVDQQLKDALKRKLEASAAAGIGYWKVDWGVHHGDTEYRRAISEVKRSVYPELIVEHAPIDCNVFSDYNVKTGKGSGRHPETVRPGDIERLAFSDVVRIYDMLGPVEYASAIDRTAYYSKGAELAGASTVLNVEDNPIIAAVLSHGIGIMRYPDASGDASVVVGARGIAEIDRLLAWREYADVYGARKDFPTRASAERISAEYLFGKEGWMQAAWGKVIKQNAPAVVSRGTPLPEVATAGSDRPFVLASRHPTGALALGVLPVFGLGKSRTPKADIVFRSPVAAGVPFAVFGRPASVTIPFVGAIAKVFASDLAGGERHDITASVKRNGGALTIDGELLARIGSEKTPANDPSEPSAILEFD